MLETAGSYILRSGLEVIVACSLTRLVSTAKEIAFAFKHVEALIPTVLQ